MKRYRFGIDFNTEYIVVPAVHEHKEGEWVEADIAEEMYEALETALECLEYNGFGKAYTVDVIRRALQKVRGE